MKHTTKKLALLLAVLTLMASLASVFVGCKGDGTGDETTAGSTSADTQPTTPDGKTEYTITVKSIGGLAMAGINVYIYTDDTLADLVNFGATDAEGIAKISLPSSNQYVAVLAGLPEGYKVEKCYPLTGTATAITVASAVIDSTDHSGKTYKIGDVMRDFKVVDSEGNTLQLSELLKTKKMVLINFWYTTCSWCVKEFPYMNSAYEKYKDEIEIVALNHYGSDTEEMVQAFKETYYETPLSFPMAKDYTGLQSAFNELSTIGYPTSVVVDRYGVICLIEAGGIVSETPFIKMFEHFTADDYQQKLITSLDDLVPQEKPNVTMPSSEEIGAVLNGAGFSATYRPETEEGADTTWPFIIGEKNGTPCIKNSNSGKDSSYAIMYADVTLKKGEALALDYWASSETGNDALVILVDRKDIYRISGEDSQWNTCYPYVALEDGTYEVAFCYLKDSSDQAGDDAVYFKNMRIVSQSSIDVPSYIFRYAATQPAADGFGYEQYITPVYNEADGYYHVGSKDGPLLLVDLMKSTRFSNTGVYYHAMNGDIVLDGKNYYDELVPYASYASNASISGMCTVDQGLKELLEIVAAAIGMENDNPNQWLQMCCYYDAYGTGGVQLQDPIKGLSVHSAYETVEDAPNEVYYDRMIMPRGLFYKFVPTKSGAYRITSNSDQPVEGWVFLEDKTEYYVYEGGERLWADLNNVSMVVYMEAGTTYLIDIAFYDVYATGGFTFTVNYLGESYDHFTIASPGYFTFPDGAEAGDSLGELAEILAGGINIALGDDGYYHELRADGTLGSILYADFIGITDIFQDDTLLTLVDKDAFDFSISESDDLILSYIALYGDETRTKLQEIWGEQFEEQAALHKLDEVLAGKLHGTGKDRTEEFLAYKDKMIAASEETPELEGCVPVDEKLASILQELMDKFTFAGVEHSWTKLCYYYRHVGA